VKPFAVVLAGLLGLAACGDNSPGTQYDAGPSADAGPTPDASPVTDFTGFVKDQILNHTDDTTDPVPFTAFATLPDDDLDDDAFAAYADLF
jgi:hypothetical protein